MKRKGISPLIAAVLLIAFTMAVASLFAQWAPQLIKEAQGDTKNTSAEIQRCSSIVLDIIDGSTNKSHVVVQQTGGESSAGNLTVTWFYDSNAPLQKFTEITQSRGTAEADVTGDAGVGTLDEVQVVPTSCEGAPPVTYSP